MLNVIDEALYALAEHFVGSDRVAEAVGVLEDVANATPDAETRSVTFFNLGVVYEEKLGDAARARACFSKVTGRMAGTARNRVLAPLRREMKWAEAVGFLKECLDNADEAVDRASVVRQLVRVARSSGDEEFTESVLSSVPGLISYEDAQEDAQARRKKMEESRRAQAERMKDMRPKERSSVRDMRGRQKNEPLPGQRRRLGPPSSHERREPKED